MFHHVIIDQFAADLHLLRLEHTDLAQGALLQVAEIMRELHFETVYAGVQGLPACIQNTRATNAHTQFLPGEGCEKATKAHKHDGRCNANKGALVSETQTACAAQLFAADIGPYQTEQRCYEWPVPNVRADIDALGC